MASNEKNSYRSIAKGTALMGSVQVFNILINIIKGKLVAIFLGAAGMGMMSLFNTSITTIQQFSSLGLNLAIVKEVAGAKNQNDEVNLKRIVSVIRRLLNITAFFGVVVTLILSPVLSRLTFGNSEYIYHYMFLCGVVYFTTLANGEMSLLQGVHALKRLALSSLVGSFIGLSVGVPLYYFLGVNGIVPAMIALAFATYLFYKIHSINEFGAQLVEVNLLSNRKLIKSLLIFGIVSMATNILGSLANYSVNTFIRMYGNLEDVGFFQASTSITSQYVGLVFTAMSIDYFPRLAAISSDNHKVREVVNQQSEIVILSILPIVCIMILCTPLLISVLLTEEFEILGPVIRIMAVGIFFKSIAYPMGYISFSKGDKKTFFWLEGIWGNLNMFFLNSLFYYFWGLRGLGCSFLINYISICFVYLILTKKLYEYKMNRIVLKLITISIIFIILCYVSSLCNNIIASLVSMTIITILAIIFSYIELNKRLSIKDVILSKYKSKRRQ